MKIHEAAAQLHLHPCELVVELVRLGAGPFDGEIFPETNQGYVDTIRQMKTPRLMSHKDVPSPLPPPEPRLSGDALAILRALRHKRHWGANIATKEQIIRHYCKGLKGYDRPLKELAQAELLNCRGPITQGPYSLRIQAKAQIERLAGPEEVAG